MRKLLIRFKLFIISHLIEDKVRELKRLEDKEMLLELKLKELN